MMKKLKIVSLTFLAIILCAYLLFLFVLPNAINLNNYKKDIQKIVKENANLEFDAGDLKIVTTPGLKAGIKASDVKISYPDKKELVTLKSGEAKISLLPLLVGVVRVSDVDIVSLNSYFGVLKNGEYDIVKHFSNVAANNNQPSESQENLPVRFSNKMPVVKASDYNITFTDEKTGNNIQLKGNKLNLSNTEIGKQLKIALDGQVLINQKPNMNFNVKLLSAFPEITASESDNTGEIPVVDFINPIVNYNPKADLNADIKIKEHDKHYDLDGFVNVDKVSFTLGTKTLPESFAHVKFAKHKTFVNSNLCLTDSEKASVNALIEHGRKTNIDVQVKSEKITFNSIKDFAQALLSSLNIKNDLNQIVVNGVITADFSIKTNLKNLESSGYLKVADGSVLHKKYPVKIDKIKADVDLSDNMLNIKNTGALINGHPLTVSGNIDQKSLTDISVKMNNVELNQLYNAFAPQDIKDVCKLYNGSFAFNLDLKGKLNELKPDATASLVNFLAGVNGTPAKVSVPDAKIKITPENIDIVPFSVYLNSSKIDISGGIKDYLNKMKIDVDAKGKVNASDIKNLLPKEAKAFVSAKGSIPVEASVNGDDKKINITAQARSDANNYFSPVTISKLVNQNGIINVNLTYMPDKLTISEASLYRNKVSKDEKIAEVSGYVDRLSSSSPVLKIEFSTPQTLVLSTPLLKNSSLKANAVVSASGVLSAPSLKGSALISDIKCPELLTNGDSVDVKLNGNTLGIKVNNLVVNGSPMNMDISASSDFGKVFLIKNMTFDSSLIDLDKLFVSMDKMNKLMAVSGMASQPVSSKGPVVPVKISKGTANIKSFKMKGTGSDVAASDIGAKFTLYNDLFKISDLVVHAYNGTIKGSATYNLATTAVTANVKGENIDANPVVTAFAGLKDQLTGKAEFSADVKLKGATYEEQMKTLNGVVKFSVSAGQLGSLGRFETFLKADNLLTQSFISSKIGSVVSKIAPYNTGKFEYLKGDLNIKNGTAYISSIKMSGPYMALYISGKMNILSMVSNLDVMGNLAPDIVGALGEVGNLSVEKFASYIPKFGTKIASAINKYNEAANKNDLSKIPALSPKKDNVKAFKVVLNGNLNNLPSAVKLFKWLNSPEIIKNQEKKLTEEAGAQTKPTKEEIKQQVKTDLKNAIEQTETVQKIKQNKTVKTIDSIYNFYKNNTNQNQNKE